MKNTLNRTSFVTDRALEYFTEKHLMQQIGCAPDGWPIALLKELIDNALDAAELAGTAPCIGVIVESDALIIEDNGPGLPASVIEKSLDYAVRVSDKSNYVSPTRGQLGNALKCVWAAPYVKDSERGCIEIHTGGERHLIEVSLDRIAQKPEIRHTVQTVPIVKNGTFIKMHYPQIASSLSGENDYYSRKKTARDLVAEYSAFNPHATFTFFDDDDGDIQFGATSREWHKWRADAPTSPHWYTPERLRTLVAAYVSHERGADTARTVREMVAEFAGLSGSAKQKQVAQQAGLSGATLQDLVEGNDINVESVARLLSAMQDATRPIKPRLLGVLGEEHFRAHMAGCQHVAPDSIRYKKMEGLTGNMPFVLEMATGVFEQEYSDCGGKTSVGLNFSPALSNPMRQLRALLGEFRIDRDDPICVLVHLSRPRLDFEDTGKSSLQLDKTMLDALQKCVSATASHWKQEKRQADRADRVGQQAMERLRKQRRAAKLDIKEAAFRVMEEAYNEVSDYGTLPANARQIMYKARPKVLALTGGKCWKNSAYFTQTILPDFIEKYPELTAEWDVAYDARGHFLEPHTERRIDLGTLAVRGYIGRWENDVSGDVSVEISTDVPTHGHANRYRYALFIEKEGFNALLDRAEIGNLYDIAIMSTKGMSVTASRTLVEKLSEAGVTTLVARDFDKAGFSIVHTLRNDTRRYQFDAAPRVIDLGLRLKDVEEMGLDSEEVEYSAGKKGASIKDPRENLIESGATEGECAFLVEGRNYNGSGWIGKRVELNAMTSPQFIEWIERKLKEHGVEKVVPDAATLEIAYKRAYRRARLQSIIDKAQEEINNESEAIELPENIESQISEAIVGKAQSWDSALSDIAREHAGE
jgi:DNA topoisomerase VI subunit B